MNNFVPAYVQALAARMSGVADPMTLIKTLMAATRQMVENTNPGKTLEDVFDLGFYPRLGVLRQDVQGIIDTFYRDDFPKLKYLTQTHPEAASVVGELLERGNQAAIATNPLFPLTAIQQRLDWAGLPVDKVSFTKVPSYETFHFAKPNPAYFAEFLAQLGWPKVPVVMVGNDVDSDIGAARQLGMPVFWISGNGSSAWNGQGEIPPHGELTDLIQWMDTSLPDAMPGSFSTPTALLAVLRSTPAALLTLYDQQSDRFRIRPAPEEWSPGEVLCHLRDVDKEVNLPRINKVLNDNNPFIPGKETDQWAEERGYRTQDGYQALLDFTDSRIELLRLLETLSRDGWDRTARHAIFGPTNLRELVNIITGHDILHVQQVYRAL